jgi:hypothetical protein
MTTLRSSDCQQRVDTNFALKNAILASAAK